MGLAAEFAEDVETVEAREHNVEDDGGVGGIECHGEAAAAIVSHVDMVAEGFQVVTHEPGQLFVVVDEEEPRPPL